MRKRLQHTETKSKTKIPTIIVMSIALFGILYFGKDVSNLMAGMFVPHVPVSDAPVAVQDDPMAAPIQPAAPSKTGTIMAQAYKNAAQDMLQILSKTN